MVSASLHEHLAFSIHRFPPSLAREIGFCVYFVMQLLAPGGVDATNFIEEEPAMTQRSVATCLMMILLATTLMVTLGGCSSSRDAMDQPVQGITVIRQIAGNDPALTATGAMLITSADELMATKSKELLKLDVKFETESLLVVSLGEQPTSGYWAWISGVQKQGSDLWVQGTANRPDPSAKVTATLT